MKWITLLVVMLSATAHALTVDNLRCEYLKDPLGIDVAKPRLSWQLSSGKQSAYQIVADNGWDTGKVDSDQSIQVEYNGPALQPDQRVTWKVRVWDNEGKPSDWCKPAVWSMGPSEWAAQWIGAPVADLQPVHPSIASGKWIAGRTFRRKLVLPSGRSVSAAQFRLAADSPFELLVNGKEAGRSDKLQTFDIAALLQPGDNAIEINLTNGKACAGQLVVKLDDGSIVLVPTESDWKTGDKDQPAKVLGRPSALALGFAGEKPEPVNPAPMLRKTFSLDKPVKRASASICGLGYYELSLNGKKVGDHILDPAFTRYDRRALYVTYDVTDRLVSGTNALGIVLGNGWYNDHIQNAWDFDNAPWRGLPKALLQLTVEYTDGTKATIVTDSSWKYSTGPILADGLLSGEIYDARLEQPGWDTARFDDSAWVAAKLVPPPGGKLSAQMEPPIRVTDEFKPVKITEPKPGVFVFHFPQNIAGIPQLTVSGPAGTEVKLQYGEMLNADGTLDQKNISPYTFNVDFQTDRYTLNGHGTEVWRPRFQYHGFQYVQVTGFPGKPTEDSLKALAAHTDLESAGSFECSNDLLNKIQSATRWSYLNNFYGHPTDCPQREKNGWTGDGHLAAEAGLYNFNSAAAYTNWMQDFRDEQRASGELPGIIPTGGWGYAWGNGPSWDSAGLLIPSYLWLYCGDTRILAEQYELMKRYVDYLTTRAKNGIVTIGLGDWCPAKTKTPAALTSTAYYFVDAGIVASVAKRLGKLDDAAKYEALAAEIKRAFNREFSDLNTQTAMSCALYQKLCEPEKIPAVVRDLASAVAAADNHLDCGILGTKYLLHALTDNGHAELAYKVATQSTPPSWGAWIKDGATTLRESWANWAGGDSYNHVMFGDISAWMFSALAGIRPDPAAPGFKHIVIKPEIVGDLTWVKAHHDTPYGRVTSSWHRDGKNLTLDVIIPPNTTSTIFLPGKEGVAVSPGPHHFQSTLP